MNIIFDWSDLSPYSQSKLQQYSENDRNQELKNCFQKLDRVKSTKNYNRENSPYIDWSKVEYIFKKEDLTIKQLSVKVGISEYALNNAIVTFKWNKHSIIPKKDILSNNDSDFINENKTEVEYFIKNITKLSKKKKLTKEDIMELTNLKNSLALMKMNQQLLNLTLNTEFYPNELLYLEKLLFALYKSRENFEKIFLQEKEEEESETKLQFHESLNIAAKKLQEKKQ